MDALPLSHGVSSFVSSLGSRNPIFMMFETLPTPMVLYHSFQNLSRNTERRFRWKTCFSFARH